MANQISKTIKLEKKVKVQHKLIQEIKQTFIAKDNNGVDDASEDLKKLARETEELIIKNKEMEEIRKN